MNADFALAQRQLQFVLQSGAIAVKRAPERHERFDNNPPRFARGTQALWMKTHDAALCRIPNLSISAYRRRRLHAAIAL